MDSFEEFVKVISSYNSKVKSHRSLYIIVKPRGWDFGIEKSCQTTWYNVSGGPTGSGTGNQVIFCEPKEVFQTLVNSMAKRAMIVRAGMVFDMTHSNEDGTPKTPITKFKKSTAWCKGHIIARPFEQAFLHKQHIEIDIVQWKKIGCPNIFQEQRFAVGDKSNINYHDDYTPYWIEFVGLPRIENFDKDDRRMKAYTYDRDFNSEWNNIAESEYGEFPQVQSDNKSYGYFQRLNSRNSKMFYVNNTETLKRLPPKEESFDIIFSPTAGYITEKICQMYQHKGEVIFYDYCLDNIQIKKAIVDMNMTEEEINQYMKYQNKVQAITSVSTMSPETLEEEYGDGRLAQQYMINNCKISYEVINIISPNYNTILEKVKGKKVLFNHSNIFGFSMAHAQYTLTQLNASHQALYDLLSKSKSFYMRGTRADKKWELLNG